MNHPHQPERKIADYITRRNLFYGFLIVVIILFFIPLRNLYEEKVIGPFLSKIEETKSWVTDVTMCLAFVTIGFGLYVLLFKRKIIVQRNLPFIIILLCIIYFFARQSPRYIFTAFDKFHVPFIYYADILLITGVGALLYLLLGLYKKNHPTIYDQNKDTQTQPEVMTSPFEIDIPIKKSKEDLFGREKFAQKIASNILASKGGVDSLAIGITGTWGSGKTSFLNRVKSNLGAENILIDFKPWNYDSPALIIRSFFDQLSRELPKEDRTQISIDLDEYAKKLIEIDDNLYTKVIKNITGYFSKPPKEEISLYEKINEQIRSLKQKIIVCIDDLDRLDKKEIIEVLRLIRNTANFGNMVYIAMYDKNYIYEAVKEINPYNYTTFLDKIFQVEFSLPVFEHQTVKEQIILKLSRKLNPPGNTYEAIGNSEIKYAVESYNTKGINFTSQFIQTQRDVIRLVNDILIEIDIVKDEIVFFDFYLLRLLKVKYPFIYKSLVDYRDYFFIQERSIVKKYRLRKLNELSGYQEYFAIPATANSTQVIVDSTVLKSFLNKNNLASLSPFEQDIIYELVNWLMNDERIIKDPVHRNGFDKEHMGLQYVHNFHKYFALRLYEKEDLPATDFRMFRKGYLGTFLEYIHNIADNGGAEKLINKFITDTEYSTKDEFENHIKGFIALVNKYPFKGDPWLLDNQMLFANDFYLLLTCDENINELIALYANNAPTSAPYDSYAQNNFTNFLRNTLGRSQPDVFFSYVVVKLIKARPFAILPLMPDFVNMNVEYLSNFCASSPGTEYWDNFWVLYWNCIEPVDQTYEQLTYIINQKAIDEMRSYVSKNIDSLHFGIFVQKKEDGKYNLEQAFFYTAFSNDFIYQHDTAYIRKDFIEIAFDHVNYIARSTNNRSFEQFSSFYEALRKNSFEDITYSPERLIDPARWADLKERFLIK